MMRACHAVIAALCLLALASACQSASPEPTPSPPSQPSPPAPATPTDAPATQPATGFAWPAYHADPARSGAIGGPAWSKIEHAWSSDQLDGDIYAEPLVVGGRVIVATEHDSVYALDAGTGRTLWQAQLGDPVDGSSLPCGNINPSGITGTPVVDVTAGTVYVVAFIQPARHDLVALDLASGSVRFRRQIDPPGADPRVEQQRAALALANGMVYVAFGGLFGDCGDYHGWLVGVSQSGSGDLVSYRVSGSRGGIWGPSGPAVDSAGALFVSTGNSNATSAPDQGDSVIKLSPQLQVLGSFTPTDWATHNARDQDLGSVGPALLGVGLVFQVGKPGVAYLLSASALGGVGGEIASASICGGAYGGTAYVSGIVYVPCRDGLVAVSIGTDPSQPALTPMWRGPRFDAGPPIVAGGLVWTVDIGSGVLYGLDPAGGGVRERESVGPVAHFTTPAADPGRVFVAAGGRIIAFAAG